MNLLLEKYNGALPSAPKFELVTIKQVARMSYAPGDVIIDKANNKAYSVLYTVHNGSELLPVVDNRGKSIINAVATALKEGSN